MFPIFRRLMLRSCVGLFASLVLLFPASAQESNCDKLEDLACISAPQCMFTADYKCQATRNRCQVGFSQAIFKRSRKHD